jgi:hypothetical protein
MGLKRWFSQGTIQARTATVHKAYEMTGYRANNPIITTDVGSVEF